MLRKYTLNSGKIVTVELLRNQYYVLPDYVNCDNYKRYSDANNVTKFITIGHQLIDVTDQVCSNDEMLERLEEYSNNDKILLSVASANLHDMEESRRISRQIINDCLMEKLFGATDDSLSFYGIIILDPSLGLPVGNMYDLKYDNSRFIISDEKEYMGDYISSYNIKFIKDLADGKFKIVNKQDYLETKSTNKEKILDYKK